MITNDGGPAFPCAAFAPSDDGIFQAGMSLRDWFAGQALSTLSQERGGQHWRAIEAYAIADAMIAVRQGKTK